MAYAQVFDILLIQDKGEASNDRNVRYGNWNELTFQMIPKHISNFCYYLQCLLKAWLTEKEEALNKVQTSNFRDQKELSVSVRRLAVSNAIVSICLVSLYDMLVFYIGGMLPWKDLEPGVLCFSIRELQGYILL